VQLALPLDDAHLRPDRPVVAKQLLHRGRRERRVFPQALELPGETQQRLQAVADVVRGRLMPGEEQEHAHRHQLLLPEPLAVVLEVHQRAQQIALRLGAARGDEGAEVLHHLACPLLRAVVLAAHLACAADEKRHFVRQLLQPRQVFPRHAEHVHDHQRGQRARELGDEVEAVASADPLQQPLRGRLDARLERLDRADVEHLRREAPQAGVVGRIAKDHPAGKAGLQRHHAARLGRRREERREAIGGKPVDVEAGRSYVLVARQDPGAEVGTPVRRVFVLEAPV